MELCDRQSTCTIQALSISSGCCIQVGICAILLTHGQLVPWEAILHLKLK